MEQFHLGELIHQKVKEKGMSIKDFRNSISKSSSAAHSIFRKDYIRTDELEEISRILGVNFFDFLAKNFEQEGKFEKAPEAKEPIEMEDVPLTAMEIEEGDQVCLTIKLSPKKSKQVIALLRGE